MSQERERTSSRSRTHLLKHLGDTLALRIYLPRFVGERLHEILCEPKGLPDLGAWPANRFICQERDLIPKTLFAYYSIREEITELDDGVGNGEKLAEGLLIELITALVDGDEAESQILLRGII